MKISLTESANSLKKKYHFVTIRLVCMLTGSDVLGKLEKIKLFSI